MYPYYYDPRPHRDYTSIAISIVILYMIGWFPGLFVNVFVLLQALFDMKRYASNSGVGCLIALFLVCGIGPIAGVLLAYLLVQIL